MSTTANGANVLKILIVGDTQLGFAEKDAIRGMDSFNTFEEVYRRRMSCNLRRIHIGAASSLTGIHDGYHA